MSDYEDQLEKLLGGPERSTYERFHGVDDDFWRWLHTEGRDASPEAQRVLPAVPEAKVQHQWTGHSGVSTLSEGFEIYRTVRDLCVETAGKLQGPVLDFGVGWGRVIRYFMKDLPGDQLWGTDQNQELLQFCKGAMPELQFNLNQAYPPLPYADGSVGLLYAYSVFSHLGEKIHLAYIDEFKRILRPGGIAALTIRPRGFIDWCERQRGPEPSPKANPITKRMFLDAPAALAAYDRGEYCFSPFGADDPEAWLGEAVIPRAYVDRVWGKRFEVVKVKTGLAQPVVLLRKR